MQKAKVAGLLTFAFCDLRFDFLLNSFCHTYG